MANTYTQIYIHTIFAVQNRTSLIKQDWKDELYKYITGIIKKNMHKLIAINGTSNHIHILIGYKPHQLIPDLIQDIKGSSSNRINEKKFVPGKFSRQAGYGAFSYSNSHIGNVVKYIKNQEKHHKRTTFKEEYEEFLRRFDIPYENKFILQDIN